MARAVSGGNMPNIVTRIAILVFALSTGVFGTAVQGHVNDAGGSGIPHASVDLLSIADAHTLLKSYTDSAGKFEFKAVPVGTYFVHIDSPGFLSVADAIEVHDGDNVNQGYTLGVARCLSCEGIRRDDPFRQILSTSNQPLPVFTVCRVIAAMDLQIPDPKLLVAIGHLQKPGSETYLEDVCSVPLSIGEATWRSSLLLTKDNTIPFSSAADIDKALTDAQSKADIRGGDLVAVYGILNTRQPLLAVKCSLLSGFCLDGFGALRAPAEIRYKGDQAIRWLAR